MRVEENGMLIFNGYRVSILQNENLVEIVAVAQLLSHIQLFATPWNAAARLPCPSLSSRVGTNSCPLSQWCYPSISSSASHFFSCPQSFPASGSFPISWFFASGGQSIGVSASVHPMNIQGWFPLGLMGLISSLVQGNLKSLLQHHSWKESFLWHSDFFMVQLSNPYMTTRKTITLTRQNFVSKVMVVTWSAWLQSKGWELHELKAWSQQIWVTHWTSSTIVIPVLHPG